MWVDVGGWVWVGVVVVVVVVGGAAVGAAVGASVGAVAKPAVNATIWLMLLSSYFVCVGKSRLTPPEKLQKLT